MSSSVAVVVGYGIIVMLLAMALLMPDSVLGRELRRAYQVQTTGVLGRFTARDFGRASMMSLFIAAVLFFSSVGAISLSFSQRGLVARTLEVVGFACFILAPVVFLTMPRSLWRAFGLWRDDRSYSRMRTEHAEIIETIREILARHNVIGLEGDEALDEFDYEALRLVMPVMNSSSYDELLAIVHAHFVGWFTPALAGPPNRFAAVAQELWNRVTASRAA